MERNNGVFSHPGFTNRPPGGSPGGAGGSPAPPSVNRYESRQNSNAGKQALSSAAVPGCEFARLSSSAKGARSQWTLVGVSRCARASILLPVLLFSADMICHATTNGAAARPVRGFSYHRDDIPRGPWSIHIVKVDRSSRSLELHTALGKTAGFGLAPLSEQVKGFPAGLGRPVAAINGDYYRDEGAYAGDPKGLQIMRGELVSGPCSWTCFWIDPEGNPQMTNVVSRFEVVLSTGQKFPFGLNEERTRNAAVLYTAVAGSSTQTRRGQDLILQRQGTNSWLPLCAGQTYSARVKEIRDNGNAPLTPDTMVLSIGPELLSHIPNTQPGAVLQISTHTSPALNGVTTAIGGGPAIVRDGKIIDRDEVNVRNPRTAIGWNRDYFYLVEVDGRQRYLSVGMTTQELSDYMIGLGCVSAMSLDGGGSATCWVYGQVMNRPSEGFERPMANSLVLVQKENK